MWCLSRNGARYQYYTHLEGWITGKLRDNLSRQNPAAIRPGGLSELFILVGLRVFPICGKETGFPNTARHHTSFNCLRLFIRNVFHCIICAIQMVLLHVQFLFIDEHLHLQHHFEYHFPLQSGTSAEAFFGGDPNKTFEPSSGPLPGSQRKAHVELFKKP